MKIRRQVQTVTRHVVTCQVCAVAPALFQNITSDGHAHGVWKC